MGIGSLFPRPLGIDPMAVTRLTGSLEKEAGWQIHEMTIG